MRTISIDGMSFPVIERRGEGEVPLLLINGMRMQQGAYTRLRENLDSPTVSFDFPLLWRPSFQWVSSPMGDIANVLLRLITELGYERVDVLGVSWGGALAIEFASLYPNQVRKLVLVSSTSRPFRHLTKPTSLLAYLKGDYGGKFRRELAIFSDAESSVGKSHIFTDLYRGWALPRWVGEGRLSSIQHPTLIVSGHDDIITPPEEARWLQRIPNSRLELIDDGHLAVYSSAAEVAGFINPFLSE